jgi:hypothetical protein
MWLVIADTAAPSTNQMFGSITSYSGTTLVMNITQILGSGTPAAWTISQSSAGGVGALSTKNPPIDADLAVYRDSAAADSLVTSTWAQVKTFLFNSPALVTPALGTPASGTLTNCTSATPAVNDNSTKLATTAFIQTKFDVYDIHEIDELCGVD